MSRILKINLALIFLATLPFSFIERAFAPHSHSYGSILLSCLLIGLLVLANFILGVVSLFRKDGNAKYFFLSILVVLLIGVPLCFGAYSI
jgi:hypothetical protein